MGKVQPVPLRRSVDHRQMRRTIEMLLSPFNFAGREDWLLACGEEFRVLCGGDAAVLVVAPEGGPGKFLSRDLPAAAMARLSAMDASTGGELHSRDSTVEGNLRRGRADSS